jgi:cysteine desulfurase
MNHYQEESGISRSVYMDHSATTPTHPDVVEAMRPYFSDHFGNPSSLYKFSGQSREALDVARAQVARALGAEPAEIFFTTGGTESDNWAIKGSAAANRKGGNHIITSSIEHHAVLHTCEYLERQGFEVTYLPVDEYGLVDPAAVEDAITKSTTLISVMMANNEIGTIEPVAEIGRIAHDHGICFHSDAVQAIGNLEIDVSEMNIDLLSLSGHKFLGPKGVGALYIRDGTLLETFMHGGGQERGRRAGTENLPGIVGLGAAISRAADRIEEHRTSIGGLRDQLLRGILDRVVRCRLNGHPDRRLCNNINISFEGIDGEALLLLLDHHGICASTGSACSSGSDAPSHVLLACGINPQMARGSLRLTLGEMNTPADVEYVLEVLPGVVEKLRTLSPF